MRNGTQEKFEVGDTVYLKSGSPLLVVVKVEHNDVHVRWYGGEGMAEGMKQAQFPPACLTRKKPK
jgi:uncharacterized protein YodC (DUF2158 family)